jgi:hypothetical protein
VPIDRDNATERRARIKALRDRSQALVERSARARRQAESAVEKANEIARFLANDDRDRALTRATDALKTAKAESPVLPFHSHRRKRA